MKHPSTSELPPGIDIKGCSKQRKEIVAHMKKRFPTEYSVWRGSGKRTPPVFPK